MRPSLKIRCSRMRAAFAAVFAQHANDVFRAVRRVAGEAVLAQELGRDNNVDMPTSGPFGQGFAVGVAELVTGQAGGHFFDFEM